jgi:hypothetical protein
LNRRGYFFVIDSLIGCAIISLSLIIILNSDVNDARVIRDYTLVDQYTGFLSTTKIEELNNQYVLELIADGNITDVKRTVLEQIGEFHYNDNLASARNLSANLTDSIIPRKYGYSITILQDFPNKDIVLYQRPSILGRNVSDAQFVLSSKRINFLMNDSATLYGPTIYEMKIWI